MSHDYHVRCLCGDTSSEWNVNPEILVSAVKESAALKALRQSGWGQDIWSINFLGREMDGLAAFLCGHFDHGGFEVVGEYKSDVPISCRPEMDYGAYASLCLDRIREEIAAIEEKLTRLKDTTKQPFTRCDAYLNDGRCCRLPSEHKSPHNFS